MSQDRTITERVNTCCPDHSPLLECKAISFCYESDSWVLENIDLTCVRGQFVGVLGPNGAGKSTLLKVLGGTLRPQTGEVLLGGQPLHKLSRVDLAKRIAFVPQRTFPAFPYTVFEMVLMGRQPYAGLRIFEDEHDLEVARWALERVGITHLAKKRFHHISGGEQQLAIVARALAQQTDILLLDEPVTYLDIRHQWEVLNILKDCSEGNKLVIGTFHDLNAASRWCTTLVLLAQGRIVRSGSPDEVLSEHVLDEVYGIALRVEKSPAGYLRVELP